MLGFSTQGYYKWLAAPVTWRDWDDAHLVNAAIDVHADDPTFGYRVITDQLNAARGEDLRRVGEIRVARLSSAQRIFSVLAKRKGTGRQPGRAVHDDLVQRAFTADQPNRLWLTDITEHPTSEGKVYLCAVKDWGHLPLAGESPGASSATPSTPG